VLGRLAGSVPIDKGLHDMPEPIGGSAKSDCCRSAALSGFPLALGRMPAFKCRAKEAPLKVQPWHTSPASGRL